ncbi:SOS response-associated peptidase family protein [Asticcacaulis sp. ZE23SCel15]|uniref:SOS response-associated peptidase n=1 Tax=Asticcacaulis sp. ZE23SCel15 TaxID=3059027 RepID=UPI00265E316C|nr:SOS response-associated peptidase family protein [Asticcacaulis sp. ZE23SCel15]WKL56681.1 SOS response-associated peptidase family protein [Asticcacaulis sp. ZE23SCel15]
MRGRFAPKNPVSWQELQDLLAILDGPNPALLDKVEIRPTNAYPFIPFIAVGKDGATKIVDGRWSLVPNWWNKPLSDFKLTTFNAKVETADTATTFKGAFAKRHCLIPVDYFWEWWGPHAADPKKKQRQEIHRADNYPMVFAGIWDFAKPTDHPDGIVSLTMLTRAAGDDLSPYHKREPITLLPDEWRDWLDLKPGMSVNYSATSETFRFISCPI